MFGGAILFSAFFPCLYICLQLFPSWCQPSPLSFHVPASVPCGLAWLCLLSPSWGVRGNLHQAPAGCFGSARGGGAVPVFPPPALLPLLPRALLQIAFCIQAPPLLAGGQSQEPQVGLLPRWRVWPQPLQPPFPDGVSLVVLGTGVQSVTRCLLKWRPKIGTWRK